MNYHRYNAQHGLVKLTLDEDHDLKRGDLLTPILLDWLINYPMDDRIEWFDESRWDKADHGWIKITRDEIKAGIFGSFCTKLISESLSILSEYGYIDIKKGFTTSSYRVNLRTIIQGLVDRGHKIEPIHVNARVYSMDEIIRHLGVTKQLPRDEIIAILQRYGMPYEVAKSVGDNVKKQSDAAYFAESHLEMVLLVDKLRQQTCRESVEHHINKFLISANILTRSF